MSEKEDDENEDEQKASTIMDTYGGTRSLAENIYLPHIRHESDTSAPRKKVKMIKDWRQWVGRADLM